MNPIEIPPVVGRSSLCQLLLQQMHRIRLIEEAIADRYSEWQMRCPVHLSIGQEAVAAGVAAALRPDDQAMSAHRSHAHYLAKGGSLNAMIAELYGKETGCCHGRGGSMHLVDLSVNFMGAVPIVGSTIPIVTGLAFANHLKKNDRVAVAFFGDAATEEGVFHESANFASLYGLAMVFVCENNLYSTYAPMAVRQPAHREIFQQALGHGMKALQGDGNDPLVVHQLMLEALEHARSRRGPVFLEFKTYRFREHCGPGFDNDLGYRTAAEYSEWQRRDPLSIFEQSLRVAGAWDGLALEKFRTSVRLEIDRAFAAAAAAPWPDPATLMNHVYA
jgi:pyruvate dehydrogenase E1 component alpha subunit